MKLWPIMLTVALVSAARGQSTQPTQPTSPAQNLISAIVQYDQQAQQTLAERDAERDAARDDAKAWAAKYAALVASTQPPASQPGTTPPRPDYASTQPYVWVQDSAGWTVPPEPNHSWFIDAQAGDDSNDGSQASPFKTTIPALKKLTDGDALLFKGGVTHPPLAGWIQKNSVQVSSYGVGRAVMQVPAVRNVALHIRASNCFVSGLDVRGDQQSTVGIVLDGNGHRLERCSVTGHSQAINISAGRNVMIYRSNLSRNFKLASSGPGYAQGAYADGAEGLTFDSCTIAYNGWNGVDPNTADVHQHGVYNHCGTPPKFATFHTRNCFVAENGSNGILGRNPGVHEDDLFLDNGIHGWGLVAGGPSSIVRRCVFTGALDAPARGTIRGLGAEFDSLNGELSDNLFIHSRGPSGPAISINQVDYNQLPMKTGRLTIARNIVRDWQGIGVQFDYDREQVTLDANQFGVPGGAWSVNYRVPPQQGIVSIGNAWVDGAVFRYLKQNLNTAQWKALVNDQPGPPASTTWSRDIEGYAQSLGLNGGESIIQRAEANGRDNWDERFTAHAVNDFLRAGQ